MRDTVYLTAEVDNFENGLRALTAQAQKYFGSKEFTLGPITARLYAKNFEGDVAIWQVEAEAEALRYE